MIADAEEARQGEKLLGDLRQALLRLHKTLLDWERSGYERIHGRQSSHDLLKALLNDPQFAWLRPMSQLIVRIDEMLGDKTLPMRNDVDAVVAQVKALTSPNETATSTSAATTWRCRSIPTPCSLTATCWRSSGKTAARRRNNRNQRAWYRPLL